jgi:anti-sigma factor RsiW
MRCEIALEALLEADTDTLGGTGEDALSTHVRECARCRAAATRFLEGERLLREGLEATAKPPAQELVDAMSRRARMPPVEPEPRSTGARPGARWRLWVPAVGAAAATVALLWPGPPSPVPSLLAPSVARTRVELPPGQDALVLETRNPEITVVWFFQGGDR